VAGLPDRLPSGTHWRVTNELTLAAANALALGWAYGSYRFDTYKSALQSAAGRARLVVPAAVDHAQVVQLASATALARDLVNVPASDMTPERLAAEAIRIARDHGASPQEIMGDELRRGFPAIHAVGQASACAPRLVDFVWGDPAHPKVTLIGKGVCFDTGGLDIKASAGMALMKKDMGGAACTLALAQLVMQSQLRVRLRVLIPAVENAIAGNAYRPGDVIRTRKGVTVEIGNTDAEGRLVLCDAIALADEEKPDLLIDLATLTGAARVALGPELPAVFGTRQETVDALLQQGRRLADPLWQMPLWGGYDDDIASKVADINNASASAFAGAIIGALYLKRFVTNTPDWVHVDLFAWNPKDRPGRPVGAEAHAVRALHAMLVERYA
jgi:leucyl aminopeptidase